MAIKKALVADSGIVSQGPITANSTVTITGATTANAITTTGVTSTGNVSGTNITASANVNATTVVATTANVTTLNVGPGSVVANTSGVFVANVNSTTTNATAINTGALTATGLANVASANVVGALNVGGAAVVGGNMTVNGTLTIQGGTTTINSTQLNVADNLITLNSDWPAGSPPSENAGVEINRGTSANTGFRWNETSKFWEAGDGTGIYSRIRRISETVTLGSETTGNYVSSVTGSGNGLTITGTGAGAAVAVTVDAANTTVVGTVMLLDSIASTSITKAPTAAALKVAYDAAISANTLAAGKVASVGGTAGRITSTGGTTPILDLVTTGVVAGTFTKLTVDAYGRVTTGAAATTTDIAEGTNQYFTTARARSSLVSGVGISYDSPSGTITNADKGSDQLFFKSIADSVGTVVFAATTNQDTLRIGGGLGITATLNATSKTISFDSTGVTSFNSRTGAITLTNADVTTALGSSVVSSFNTRTGAVTLSSADVTGALGYTPADSGTAGGTNASALSTGTVPTGRLSGAYNGITSVGTLSSLTVGGIIDGNQHTSDAGNAGNPGYTFNVDGDTGMYRIGVNRLGFATAGAQRMEINSSSTSVTGNFTATGTGTFSSDIRLKKDIVSIDSGEGVNVVMALEPVKFTRLHDGTRSAGYIAQQFREVAPEQVREDCEGMLSIDQIDASPYQTAAIQWLVNRVRSLEDRISRLEGK
jgi:hypothetical protein